MITAFEDEPLSELLLANVPALWPEAARVIVEVSAGNIDYALKCAKALIAQGSATARQLVSPSDIRQFIVDELPGGALFLASCALALLSRLGFDGVPAEELRIISKSLGIPENDLRAAASQLAANGLLARQGRYRSVGPSPVAIYLASSGWSEFGSRVVTDLIPQLSDEMVHRLFARAAEIGDASLPREVVDRMLGADGPLSSLEAVSGDRRTNLLDHLAILSPARVSRRIWELLESSSQEALQAATAARQSLVWALQELAWHRATFAEAADSLLRLALAENETYSNNSTAVWIELFGTMLPSTAATPDSRLSYLREKAQSEDPVVRKLVVRAARRALDTNESTIVSGELQGGGVVEPRGMPATRSDSWDYRNAAVDLARSLADDPETSVADAAVEALTGAIHGFLDIDRLRDHLAATLATLLPSQLERTRAEIASLESLYSRSGDERNYREALDAMVAALPEGTIADRLWVVSHSSPWDRRNSDVEAELLGILSDLRPAEAALALAGTLTTAVPTDFSIGRAIGRLGAAEYRIEKLLVDCLGGPNQRALIGYLLARDEADPGAYDSFVDAANFDAVVKLRLTAQGPSTARSEVRIAELLRRVSVADGARTVFYRVRDSEDEEALRDLIVGWKARVETQADYNALVDVIAFALHDRPGPSAELSELIGEIVMMRKAFPDVGQQSYDWVTLARGELERAPERVLDALVELVESDAVRIFSDSHEKQLFRNAIGASDPSAWCRVMDRLALRDSWRLSFAARGWLADAADLDVVKEWLGESEERARVVAPVASVGDNTLGPVASFLLERFPDDETVSAILLGDFVSGGWTGNESVRTAIRLHRLDAGSRSPANPKARCAGAAVRLATSKRSSTKSCSENRRVSGNGLSRPARLAGPIASRHPPRIDASRRYRR
ncbi:hypothetical protein QWJ90_00230 [Microbacterium oryzae]|uniref:hypothetical protein n=1 Tax=Microbacterium oryzae TaxID=743009 RepID=UPI0025B00029|nr:hypothetical protein [Microbacterium oryzae]MDN3309354.1 hypothetical protein [Microbacterium oryzae]